MGVTATGNAPGWNWGALMAAAQDGDADAYTILLSEVAVWLCRYFARRLPPVMTDDAIRNVLLTIHENRHTYDPARAFQPWLADIAHYEWLNRLRSLKYTASAHAGENSAVTAQCDPSSAIQALQQALARLKRRPPQQLPK